MDALFKVPSNLLSFQALKRCSIVEFSLSWSSLFNCIPLNFIVDLLGEF